MNFLEDANQNNSQYSLDDLTASARELYAKSLEYKQCEDKLKEIKAELNELETNKLPLMMNEMGYSSSAPIGDDYTLQKTSGYSCSIPSESYISRLKDEDDALAMSRRRDDALDWLRSNGFGSIIKDSVSFETSDAEQVEALVQISKVLKIPCHNSETVNSRTLSSFVKEQMESETGADIPEALFSVYFFEKVKIKKTKTNKKK